MYNIILGFEKYADNLIAAKRQDFFLTNKKKRTSYPVNLALHREKIQKREKNYETEAVLTKTEINISILLKIVSLTF